MGARAESARRPGRPGADTPAVPEESSILQRGLEAFAELGYDHASARELARRLGVSHNFINDRYGSKAAFWRAVVDSALGAQLAGLPQVDDSVDDAERLRAVGGHPSEGERRVDRARRLPGLAEGGQLPVHNSTHPTQVCRIENGVVDPLADLGTFLAYRDPAVDPLLDSPAATDPGFPGPLELAEQYALLSGRDITRLPFYQALAYFKIAVIAEGVHSRHQQGVTVGDGFAGAGASVPRLVRAGLALLGRRR
ncbi:TetR family transcriptional regulator [Streptomyces sp. NPDC054940]